VRFNLRGGARCCGAVRVAPARSRRRKLAAAGGGEQGPEEEGAAVAAQVRVRGQQPEQVGGDDGMRDLPGRFRRRRRDSRAAAVRPRLPRVLHRQVAGVPLLLPFLPPGPRRRQVSEVRPLSGHRRRSLENRRR